MLKNYSANGKKHGYKSVVFSAGAARRHTPMSVIYFHGGGIYYSGRDILVTPTRCEGNTLHRSAVWLYAIFTYDTPDGCPALCGGENLRTNIHT